MKFSKELARMSFKVIQTSDDFIYYIRDDRTEKEFRVESEHSLPKPEIRREGYYESQIYPGLFFHKYQLDVELDGQAGLTATQFAILALLDDEGGEVSVDRVKGQCWEEPPERVAFANHITELNKRLCKIGVEKNVSVNGKMLLFQ